MKYILKTLASGTETEYSSLSQISRDLNVTYSAVWKSYQYDINPGMKRGIKQSQQMFDKKYSVHVVK
jgi:hypothetical protein